MVRKVPGARRVVQMFCCSYGRLSLDHRVV